MSKKNMDPNNNANWALVCSICGADYAMNETIDLIEGHHAEEHPDQETASFNLVWVGIGPKPKSRRK